MSRFLAVVGSLAGAVIFSVPMGFAHWKSKVGLSTRESIVLGVIAALGFAIMMAAYGVARGGRIVVLDGAVVLLLLGFVYPKVSSRADPNALFDEATGLYKRDQYRQAIPLFEKFLRKNPRHALANARLGMSYCMVSQYETAIPYLQKAISLDPTDYQSRSNLGLLYERLGKAEEGVEWVRQAAKLQPRDAAVLNNFGVVLLSANHAPEAADAFQRAVRFAPHVPEYRENLARARKAAAPRPPS